MEKNVLVYIHIKAENDVNGNPRRAFLVFALGEKCENMLGDKTALLDVVDEEYLGVNAVTEKYPGIIHLATINVKAKEYRDWLKMIERRRGKSK